MAVETRRNGAWLGLVPRVPGTALRASDCFYPVALGDKDAAPSALGREGGERTSLPGKVGPLCPGPEGRHPQWPRASQTDTSGLLVRAQLPKASGLVDQGHVQ